MSDHSGERPPRPSLRRRILRWMVALAVFVTIAIISQGLVVNEYVERIIWKSLLTVELDHFIQRIHEDPLYKWDDTAGFVVFVGADDPALPPPLRGLPPGLHDDIDIGIDEHVALVKDDGGVRYTLAMNIAQFDSDETRYDIAIIAAAAILLVVLAAVIAFSLRHLLQPLSQLAQRIGALRPERGGERVHVAPDASSELTVIADAFNGYLQRNEQFVRRERNFIDSASHELRTPIGVIAGASELALEQPGVPAAALNQMQRVHSAAREVEQLISLLLVLAKDPQRLARNSDRVALEQLLPEIVADHRALTRGKDLRIEVATLPHCEIVAPLPIVQVAIGNLLRNAIENSDRGRIRIELQADATVVIDDPGHGMSPEEISKLYTQVARHGRDGGGIGLDLISRLCEHLGWQLDFTGNPEGGTRTTLRLQADA